MRPNSGTSDRSNAIATADTVMQRAMPAAGACDRASRESCSGPIRQKHPCSRVNRLTKTRASGYNLAALSVGLYSILACFSRRATCGFGRPEQLKCRLDATRLPGIPSVSYIVPRHVGDAALYTEAGQSRL